MKILAVDQSLTKCAWCLFQDGILVKAGLIATSPDTGDDYIRTKLIANEINKIAQLVDVVVCEGLAFAKAGNATRTLAGLLFTIHNLCDKPCFDLAPTTVKKFATGKGNATKAMMVAALPKKTKEYFQLEMNAKVSTGLYDLTDAFFIGRAYIETNKEV